ncbi:MAG: site-specific integrase [Nevskiaceae bacterium]|nr:MAG: site-specific integrase [Nevskiaceae bacterium]TAM27042.1 MAG: site-specific integrase [Nevskiaceae bacterium]
MQLFLSTDDFRLHGHTYPNFPILVSQAGEIENEVLQFCVKHLIKRGRVQSIRSWEKYGKDLLDFFDWCEVNQIDWRDIGNDRESTILAEYRDWALGEEVGNSPRTVNGRLRLLMSFYRFAYNRGSVSSVPYEMETISVRQPVGFLAHADATAGQRLSPDVLLRTAKPVIRVLSRDQARSLVAVISNPTHKLAVRLALTTGMRREEIATFPAKYVIDPRTYTKFRSFIRVVLDPRDMSTKGNRARGIDVPRTVMEDMWQYRIDTRHQLEQQSGVQSSALFLSEDGLPFQNHGAALLGVVKTAGAAAGIPYINVHVLRHTYATHTLYSMMKRKSETNALLYVRDRLGHASVTTTEAYLHCLSEVEDGVMNDYQADIDAITREASDA